MHILKVVYPAGTQVKSLKFNNGEILYNSDNVYVENYGNILFNNTKYSHIENGEGEIVFIDNNMNHGEYEYGSPILPMIPEAEILHYIDNIDARMNVFGKIYEGINEGEFTPRQFALENRAFYKSKL